MLLSLSLSRALSLSCPPPLLAVPFFAHCRIRGAMIYSLTALGGAALLSILGGWSTCMYFYGSVYAVTVLHLYFELGGDLNLGIGDQHN